MRAKSRAGAAGTASQLIVLWEEGACPCKLEHSTVDVLNGGAQLAHFRACLRVVPRHHAAHLDQDRPVRLVAWQRQVAVLPQPRGLLAPAEGLDCLARALDVVHGIRHAVDGAVVCAPQQQAACFLPRRVGRHAAVKVRQHLCEPLQPHTRLEALGAKLHQKVRGQQARGQRRELGHAAAAYVRLLLASHDGSRRDEYHHLVRLRVADGGVEMLHERPQARYHRVGENGTEAAGLEDALAA
mmetsp:Transcript_14326/g.47799  ORF Transcript_14326/g.47799 Transcript_14326/m.47799 type:complete len:241 (+) Transcript_14326:148-870(+)